MRNKGANKVFVLVLFSSIPVWFLNAMVPTPSFPLKVMVLLLLLVAFCQLITLWFFLTLTTTLSSVSGRDKPTFQARQASCHFSHWQGNQRSEWSQEPLQGLQDSKVHLAVQPL